MYLKLKNKKILLVLLLILSVATFVYYYKDAVLQKEVPFSSLNGWKNQDFLKLKEVFVSNCQQMDKFYNGGRNRKPADDVFGTLEQWSAFCSGLKELAEDKTEIKNYFEKLTLLKFYHPFDDVSLFTGYYAPLLEGSYTKSEKYNYPIYSKPKDLIEVSLKDFFKEDDYRFKKIFARVENQRAIPFYTREQIDNSNVLKDEDVIVWVSDKVGAFFLHIQGSGAVKLDTGEKIMVGYAGQNGHEYKAIGGFMAEKGMIDKETISLQTIRDYLMNNPDEVNNILKENPSYIFFVKREDGPYGAFGNVLTPNHSIAVDRRFIPLGLPLFVDTKVTATGESFQKMVFAQDVGGAIKGEIRADIYFGEDEKAEEYSGKQNQEGVFYAFSAANFN